MGEHAAKMKVNLVDRYKKALPGELDGHEDSEEIITFLKSIENKEVVLVFTAGDAFEKNDNNIWLPDDLWELVW